MKLFLLFFALTLNSDYKRTNQEILEDFFNQCLTRLYPEISLQQTQFNKDIEDLKTDIENPFLLMLLVFSKKTSNPESVCIFCLNLACYYDKPINCSPEAPEVFLSKFLNIMNSIFPHEQLSNEPIDSNFNILEEVQKKLFEISKENNDASLLFQYIFALHKDQLYKHRNLLRQLVSKAGIMVEVGYDSLQKFSNAQSNFAILAQGFYIILYIIYKSGIIHIGWITHFLHHYVFKDKGSDIEKRVSELEKEIQELRSLLLTFNRSNASFIAATAICCYQAQELQRLLLYLNSSNGSSAICCYQANCSGLLT